MRGTRITSAVVAAVLAGAGATLWASGAAGAAGTVDVHGTLHGSYRLTKTPPDTGVRWRVHGHGRTSLGSTQVSGHVRGPGFIDKGHCTAHLLLATSHGTVTIRGTSAKRFRGESTCQSGFALHWHITKSTGGYRGTEDSGTGTLTLVKANRAAESPPPFYLKLDR